MKKLLVVFMALILLVGCSSKGGKDDTIKIGANFELSGQISSYGSAEINGVQLAIKEVNGNGGINGKQIELVQYDNKSDASEAVNIAVRLLTNDNVSAIIGPATSGLSKATIASCNQYQIPMVTPSGTNDDVTLDAQGNTQPYAYRICYKDSFQGVTLANFLANNLNKKSVVILGDVASDYSKGLSQTFTKQFESLGGKVVLNESYSSGDTDFNAVLTKIKSATFDALYIPGYYQEVGLIIKQARNMGINNIIIGGDGFDSSELINLAGKENLNEVYFSTHYSNVDSEVKTFIDSFKKEFNVEPNAFSALAYDATMLVIDAIKRAPSTKGVDVAKALNETKELKGITGTVSVDDKHDAIKSVVIVKLVNGDQAEAYKVNP
ncbi:MAG: ABC transporter substrate-binding protein [Erysipelotrichaceae bacterium]